MTNFKFVAGDLCFLDILDQKHYRGLVEIISVFDAHGHQEIHFQVLNGGKHHGVETYTEYYVKNFKKL